MKQISRRQFLDSSGKSVAGIVCGSLALSAALPHRVLGANDRINLALIGCGGRGRYLARGMIEQGANLSYLCDLHDGRLADTAKFLSDVQQKKPKFSKDMHELFNSNDIDAVIIATPDHWHGPAAILACQAGKDVYVEKPHSYNIWESRQMLRAARKYNRILQIGTQNRSAPYNLAAREYIKTGKLGDIRLVKVYNLKPGGPFKLGDAGTIPDNFNWDTWLGTRPERPYHQHIFNGGWHHFWDFSGGDLADDAAHQIDLAMMLMGNPGMSAAVSSSGGRLQYKGDDSEVPDLLVTAFDFDNFVMTLEHSNYPRYMQKTTGTIRRNDEFPYWTQNATRIELYGSELMMTIGRHGGGWQVTQSGGRVVEQMYGRFPDPDHQKNFLECLISRKKPNADIEILHPSCTLLHMANIAHRVGNKKLWFDAQTETFINNTDANNLIKSKYREKFQVPENV
ncbi:MAG: Gfo/Idh/MocA family oxidoreductase [Sedimentisphaerales bacterium]|nr:Gfo/Idh/MocA family oxidoreductase [Sedimentisphaerales bacterium]